MRDRSWYPGRLGRWLEVAETYWDAGPGTYGPDVRVNAQLLPALVLQARHGRAEAARRACHLARKLVSSPPWDPEFHYFNSWDALGLAPRRVRSHRLRPGLGPAPRR